MNKKDNLPLYLPQIHTWLLKEYEGNFTSMANTEKIISKLSDKKWLYYFIKNLITDKNSLDLISKSSFIHTTGVIKLILFTNGRSFPELRIHIWKQGFNRELNNLYKYDIHDHRWSYSSNVIIGNIQHNLYSENVSEGEIEKFHYYLFTSLNSLHQNKIDYIGTMGLCKVHSIKMNEGSIYSLDRNIIHSIYPRDDNLCATLMIRQPYLSNVTRIFSTSKKPLNLQSGNIPRISANEIQSILTNLLASHIKF